MIRSLSRCRSLSLLRAALLAPLLAVVLAPTAPSQAGSQAGTWLLVDIDGPSSALAGLASRSRIEIVGVLEDGGWQAVLPASELSLLVERGLLPVVREDDLSAFYASRLERPAPGWTPPGLPLAGAVSPPFGAGSMGGYYTYDEVASVLDQLAAAHPAIMTSKASIGTSVEGRDLWMVKVSDNPGLDEAEPEVRLDSLHHAREPQSMQTGLWFLMWLLDGYGEDPLATHLVDEREIFFVPVVNPDGYAFNETTDPGGGGMWRKNRRDNGDGSFGVDLNRNYPSQWGYDDSGSSPFTSSDVYRGPGPASEPETQAMTAFMASRAFRTALSMHTFSDLWLAPFGYDTLLPGNWSDYDAIGQLAVADNGYLHGPAALTLYAANGVTTDHDHLAHDTLCWTPEIGGSDDGFWPPTSRIVPLAEENLTALQRTVLAAGSWARVADVATIAVGDGDGDLEPGEELSVVIDVANSGLDPTATPVLATLTGEAGLTVVDGVHDFGILASMATADNAAAPLALAVDPGVAEGTALSWTLTLSADGLDTVTTDTVVVGSPRPLLADDLEVDFGWTVGAPGDTATTGVWERGDPAGTSYAGEPSNPEDDATPGPGTVAFVTGNAGGSAGTDDVDDGATTLLSPVFDLSDMGPVVLSYARWFANLTSPDDSLEIALSADGGGSWTTLESVGTTGDAWTTASFLVPDVVSQTDQMRLAVIASDTGSPSLVEGGLDDVRLDLYDTRPRIQLWGTPSLGSPVLFDVSAAAGSSYTWYASAGTGELTVGSIQGPLLLDLATLLPFVSGSVPAGGLDAVPITVPTDGALVGLTAYFQALVNEGGTKFLTNRVEATVP